MAYQPYNATRIPPVSGGVTFFGATPQDPVYNSDSAFIYDGSYLSVPSLKIDNGGTIGSDSYPGAIQISANGTVSIANNLNVAGTFTAINTETTLVRDPLLHLGSGNTGDINDIGFFGQYNDGVNDEYAGLFRDASDANNVFRLFTGLQEEPSGTVNTAGTGYTVGTLVASLSGNADTATKLANTRTFAVSGQATSSSVGFDGSNNVTLDVSLTSAAIHDQISAPSAAAGDYILMASGTTGPLFKISKGDLLSNLGGGTMSDFNLLDEDGTARSIAQGTYVQLSGVDGLSVTSAGAGTPVDPFLFSVSYDFSELTATALGSGDTFLVQDSLGAYQKSNITQLGTYLAGDGINVGGDGVLSVDQNSVSGVALDAVFVSDNFKDTATIDFTVDEVNHAVSGVVKDNSITETKLSRTVSTHTATGPTNLTVGSEDVILVNMDATADTDTVTVTLPNPNTKSGRIITVKRVSNTLGTTDDGILSITSAAGNIDGSSNVQLYYRFEVFRFVSNGSNWFII